MSIVDSLPYRSPIPKLLVFFRHSRDQWKAKCKAAKYENKSLKTRLAKMKESRDRWKAEARCLRSDLQGDPILVARHANATGSLRNVHPNGVS